MRPTGHAYGQTRKLVKISPWPRANALSCERREPLWKLSTALSDCLRPSKSAGDSMFTQAEKGKVFRALHERAEAFIIPNPWDAGTAKILAHLGFEALATTSMGY